MNGVNIYINVNFKSEFVYKLINQLYSKSVKLIIVLNNYEEIINLDFILWHKIVNSFLAHTVWKEQQQFPFNSPIVLTIFKNLMNFDINYTILNLSDQYVNHEAQKIIEIFENNQDDLERARKYYAFYKSKNYKIKHFDISKC